MGKSLKEKMLELPKDQRESILEEADRLHKGYMTLQELRKAMGYTQEQLAEKLRLRQASIAKLEQRSDYKLSTLSSYVEAMGGSLSLMVEFPDWEPVSLDRNIDGGESAPKQRKKPQTLHNL